MLAELESMGLRHIAGFYPHGRAFGILDPEAFKAKILPIYFKKIKYSSFCRQLGLYGFSRIQTGPDSGAYYHELFLQGKPELCQYLRRVGLPVDGEDRRRSRPTKEERKDPDLYSMRPL